jgi:hypothetical protein
VVNPVIQSTWDSVPSCHLGFQKGKRRGRILCRTSFRCNQYLTRIRWLEWRYFSVMEQSVESGYQYAAIFSILSIWNWMHGSKSGIGVNKTKAQERHLNRTNLERLKLNRTKIRIKKQGRTWSVSGQCQANIVSEYRAAYMKLQILTISNVFVKSRGWQLAIYLCFGNIYRVLGFAVRLSSTLIWHP